MAGPDYILDIASLKPRDASSAAGASGANAGGGDAENSAGLSGRPWLAIRWRCCGVYSRVYRNADATAYEGRCPHCGKRIRAAVGEGGTDSRFFEAG